MHVGDSCVGIYDAFDVTHLLCHVVAEPGLERGDRVYAGQVVAEIARAYEADNLGFPHLHYALHTRVEKLRLVDTIPFTGRYALEGEELIDTGEIHGAWGIGCSCRRTCGGRRRPGPGICGRAGTW